jgi:aspartyl-tRNA(Asn)/glutamyl-tRNA(Gln) amidotransferase subunit C
MKLSREEVLHVAALARLDLGDDEVERLRQDLSSILTYVEKLSELDTAAVAPTSHVVAMRTPYREDEVLNTPDTAAALANAPRRDGDFFSVPAIIE